MNEPKNEEIIALRDGSKNTFLVELKNETIKIKGIGVFNPFETIKNKYQQKLKKARLFIRCDGYLLI